MHMNPQRKLAIQQQAKPQAVPEVKRYWKLPLAPEKIKSELVARDLFDQGFRIFVVPHKIALTPDHAHDKTRQLYSFTNWDWFRNIQTPQERAADKARGIRNWEEWKELMAYSLCQTPLNPATQTRDAKAYVDFYRHVPPEVHFTNAIAPDNGEPYHLHWDYTGEHWFFIAHAPQPNPQPKPKKGKKA